MTTARRKRLRFTRLVGIASTWTLPGVAFGQDARPPISVFLSTSVGLSPDDQRAVERGAVATHLLPSGVSRDISIVGILAIDVTRAAMVAYLGNTPSILRIPARRAFGIVRDSATPTDFDGVTLSARDAAALRKCRPGSCAFKLSSSDMIRLRTLLTGSDDSVKAIRFQQRRLASIANGYRRSGNDAMPTYNDGSVGVRGADAFASLHLESHLFDRFTPGLREYLDGYPRVHIAQARDILYWARDEPSGFQPTTTLNHRIFYSIGGAGGVTIVARKQVVADHYLDGALEVMVVVDRPAATGAGVYLMIMRQYRFDQIPSTFRISLRGRLIAKLRERLESDLLRMKVSVTTPGGR